MPAATPRKSAAAAQRAEALGEMIVVPFEGYDYEVPPVNTWDISVIEAQEAGQITRALRAVLGDTQWAAFRERHTTVGPMKDFYNKINQAAVGEGNS